jgi:hypothetical protein
MSITIKVIKQFTKSTSQGRDTYFVDLDHGDNVILKDEEAIESDEFRSRFVIVSRLIFANKSKDILLYTIDLDKISEHLQRLAKNLEQSVVASMESTDDASVNHLASHFFTNMMTASIGKETKLEGGLTRGIIELRYKTIGGKSKRDTDEKRREIRIEHYTSE